MIERRLRGVGVRPEIIEEITSSRTSHEATRHFAEVFIALGAIASAIGLAFLFNVPKTRMAEWRLAEAEASNALLFLDDGVLFLAPSLLACWMIAILSATYVAYCVWIRSRAHRLSLAGDATALRGGHMDLHKVGLKDRMARWLFCRRMKHDPDFDRFYIRRIVGFRRGALQLIGVMLALGAIGFAHDVRSLATFDETGATRRSLLSGDATLRPWSSATKLAVGCRRLTRRGKRRSELDYEVTFADGAREFVGKAIPVRGDYVDALEIIDARLSELGVRRELDVRIDPRCVRHFAGLAGDDGLARINALLRLTDTP